MVILHTINLIVVYHIQYLDDSIMSLLTLFLTFVPSVTSSYSFQTTLIRFWNLFRINIAMEFIINKNIINTRIPAEATNWNSACGRFAQS